MSLPEENRVAELGRRNAELQRVVATLLARADEVFSSRPWRLGRVLAAIERPFRKLFLREERRFRHLTPDYFHSVTRNLVGVGGSEPVVTGRPDDAPPVEVDADVQTTLAGLWNAVRPEHVDDAR